MTDDLVPPPDISISCADFEDRAREHNVYDVAPFYKSTLFSTHGFERDEAQNVISRRDC